MKDFGEIRSAVQNKDDAKILEQLRIFEGSRQDADALISYVKGNLGYVPVTHWRLQCQDSWTESPIKKISSFYNKHKILGYCKVGEDLLNVYTSKRPSGIEAMKALIPIQVQVFNILTSKYYSDNKDPLLLDLYERFDKRISFQRTIAKDSYYMKSDLLDNLLLENRLSINEQASFRRIFPGISHLIIPDSNDIVDFSGNLAQRLYSYFGYADMQMTLLYECDRVISRNIYADVQEDIKYRTDGSTLYTQAFSGTFEKDVK